MSASKWIQDRLCGSRVAPGCTRLHQIYRMLKLIASAACSRTPRQQVVSLLWDTFSGLISRADQLDRRQGITVSAHAFYPRSLEHPECEHKSNNGRSISSSRNDTIILITDHALFVFQVVDALSWETFRAHFDQRRSKSVRSSPRSFSASSAVQRANLALPVIASSVCFRSVNAQ